MFIYCVFTKTNYFIQLSPEDKLRHLTDWGMRLFLSVVTSLSFPDGSRVTRLWLGGCSLLVCFGFCADISLYRYHWCSGKLVTQWRASLTWAMHKPCQLLRMGARHNFGEKVQCQNFNIYSINEEIIQTQKQLFSLRLNNKAVLCLWESLYV